MDTFAFSRCYCQYQNSLEIPGSEVPENCLASFVADSLQQMLLSVPKLVGDSRVGSSRKLPGQLRCRQPTRLASAFYTCFRLLGPFHRESEQSTAQEVARGYATWILRRVYHGLSSDFCQALGFQTCLDRPVRPVLRLSYKRPKTGRVAQFVRQSRWFSTGSTGALCTRGSL